MGWGHRRILGPSSHCTGCKRAREAGLLVRPRGCQTGAGAWAPTSQVSETIPCLAWAAKEEAIREGFPEKASTEAYRRQGEADWEDEVSQLREWQVGRAQGHLKSGWG